MGTTNSEGDESDSLLRASTSVDVAWEEVDFTACNEERLELEEKKKDGKLKTLLKKCRIGNEKQ